MTCQISFAAWFRWGTCSNVTILSATLIIIQTPITWAEINLMSHSIINERHLYIPQHLFVDWNQSTPFTKYHKCSLNQNFKIIQNGLSNRDKVHIPSEKYYRQKMQNIFCVGSQIFCYNFVSPNGLIIPTNQITVLRHQVGATNKLLATIDKAEKWLQLT